METSIPAPDVRRVAYAVFQPADGMQKGLRSSKVVAVTSPLRKEGATFVAHMLCRELGRDPIRRTLYCTTEALACVSPDADLEQRSSRVDGGYWVLNATTEQATGWEFDQRARSAAIGKLRHAFDYVILDCPAVHASPDISAVADLVSSVLLVVGAGMSTSKQVLYAEQVIVSSGGTLSGCILNRRTYPIPNLVYGLLHRRKA